MVEGRGGWGDSERKGALDSPRLRGYGLRQDERRKALMSRQGMVDARGGLMLPLHQYFFSSEAVESTGISRVPTCYAVTWGGWPTVATTVGVVVSITYSGEFITFSVAPIAILHRLGTSAMSHHIPLSFDAANAMGSVQGSWGSRTTGKLNR